MLNGGIDIQERVGRMVDRHGSDREEINEVCASDIHDKNFWQDRK